MKKTIVIISLIPVIFIATNAKAITMEHELRKGNHRALSYNDPRQNEYWKIYVDIPQVTHGNACAYSDVTGAQTVWSLGGGPGGTTILEFDCATESWTTSSAVLNHGTWRAAAAPCMGKIYVIGGIGAGNYVQEFDPVAGTVTDVAQLLTARHSLGALCWNDTLIYVIGGQSSGYHNVVEIYDPTNDAWTVGTPMPISIRSFACGIQTDTIYTAGGYNGSGYVSNCYAGAIDPADPQTIVWLGIPDIPTGPSGMPGRIGPVGACVATSTGWRFYFTCGNDHGFLAWDTWYYEPGLSLWYQTLNKPNHISNAQCAVYVPNPFDGGVFFCVGGGTATTEGLINIGPGIFETQSVKHRLVDFGFTVMANPSKGIISYTTSMSGKVVLTVYDDTGRFIETLVNAVQPAGVKIVKWDTRNITNGIYFLKLEVQGKIVTKKITVIHCFR